MATGTLEDFDQVKQLKSQLMDQLITPAEYAGLVGLGSTKTVLRRVAKGQLRSITMGRDIYIWVGELSDPPERARPSRALAIVKDKPKSSTRGTRLPEGWMPKDESVAQIKAEFPGVLSDDLTREHRKFSDYFLGAPGQKGVKVNWDSAWKNWMRTADGRGELRYARLRQPDKTAAKMEGYLESGKRLAAQIREGQQGAIDSES